MPHFTTLRKISIQNVFNFHKECDQLVAQYYFLVVVRSPATNYKPQNFNNFNNCKHNSCNHMT